MYVKGVIIYVFFLQKGKVVDWIELNVIINAKNFLFCFTVKVLKPEIT